MSLVALLLAISTPIAAVPMQAERTAEPTSLPDASSNDDVIVTGLKIPRQKLPTGVYWNYQSLFLSKIARENAEMFLQCALKKSDTSDVRQVVDGEPNSATARFAQGWIKQTHRGCYPPTGAGIAQIATNRPDSIADLGISRLERGVIVELALRTYAPDVALTPEMTADPAVQSRFQQREGLRNRLRLPDDRDALVFASCLVKEQPILATRLFRSDPGSLLERGLTQTIIVEGRACVGPISRVTVDPSLLRVYVMDAFYRWVVAARGVDSLIPADA